MSSEFNFYEWVRDGRPCRCLDRESPKWTASDLEKMREQNPTHDDGVEGILRWLRRRVEEEQTLTP